MADLLNPCSHRLYPLGPLAQSEQDPVFWHLDRPAPRLHGDGSLWADANKGGPTLSVPVKSAEAIIRQVDAAKQGRVTIFLRGAAKMGPPFLLINRPEAPQL
jgi:hypothetical protein